MPTGKRKRDELESDDEGDSDDLYDDEEDENNVNNGKNTITGDNDYRPPRKSTDADNDSLNESTSSADLNRSKRQRKEKKIFDL